MNSKMRFVLINYVLILITFCLSRVDCRSDGSPLMRITHDRKWQTFDSNANSRTDLDESDDMLPLVSVDNCLHFYMQSLTLIVTNESNSQLLSATFDSLRDKPSIDESKCWQNDGREPALLDVTYENSAAKLRIKLMIHKNKNGLWQSTKGYAVISLPSEEQIKYELIVDDISSGDQFSYSCSKLKIVSKVGHKTNKYGLTRIALHFNGFQLQPFENRVNERHIFIRSEDCQRWTTVPLWSGFFTLSLFTNIVLIGVYMLSNIKTPDRFENPKTKSLIITDSNE